MFKFLKRLKGRAPMSETEAPATQTPPAPTPKSPSPTVGRVVNFNPGIPSKKGQFYPALITHVFSDTTVNLCVLNDGSWPLGELTPTSVTFSEDGAAARSWSWMPFQKGQAGKVDDLGPRIATLEKNAAFLVKATSEDVGNLEAAAKHLTSRVAHLEAFLTSSTNFNICNPVEPGPADFSQPPNAWAADTGTAAALSGEGAKAGDTVTTDAGATLTLSLPREITTHHINDCNRRIVLKALDAPGQGGACHEYEITVLSPRDLDSLAPGHKFTRLSFQNGPIKEVGTNGITHEVLIAVLEDRLKSFQAGPYASIDNAEALECLRQAKKCLNRRTASRVERGVEGTHQV